MGRARDFASKGNQGRSALVLDSSSAGTDVLENILLEGTDSSSSNSGSFLMQEDFGTHVSLDNLPPGSRPLKNEEKIRFRTGMKYGTFQSLSHNTVAKCQYDAVYEDYLGNANMKDNPAKFTCTVPGLYYVSHNAYITSDGTPNTLMARRFVMISKTDTSGQFDQYYAGNFQVHSYNSASSYNMKFIFSIWVEKLAILREGDFLEPEVYVSKTGASTLRNYTYGSTGFYGMLIQRYDSLK